MFSHLVFLHFSRTFKKNVAQSNTKGKYLDASYIMNQAICLRNILKDLEQEQLGRTQIFYDNKYAITMIKKNSISHGKIKHINMKYHFIHEVEKARDIELVHYYSKDQLVSTFTKPLPKGRFESLKLQLGVSRKIFKEENVGNDGFT